MWLCVGLSRSYTFDPSTGDITFLHKFVNDVPHSAACVGALFGSAIDVQGGLYAMGAPGYDSGDGRVVVYPADRFTVHVSPTGHDFTNSGMDASSPFFSLRRALAAAGAHSRATQVCNPVQFTTGTFTARHIPPVECWISITGAGADGSTATVWQLEQPITFTHGMRLQGVHITNPNAGVSSPDDWPSLGGLLRVVGGVSEWRDVVVELGAAVVGGCVAVEGATLVLWDTHMKYCTASVGGGIALRRRATVEMHGGSVTECSTSTTGGGILVGGSSSLSFVAHAGPVVVALNAAALSGGGVAATFGSTVSSKGTPAAVDFQNCFAPTGGCMHSDAAHLDIANASFTDCAAGDAAGAMYASGTPPGSHCTGCSFSQNTVNSAAGAGSAVYAVGEASMLLSECTLTDNIAGLHGGAVAAEGAATRVDMHGCSFAGNAVSNTAGSGGHVFAGAGVFMSVTGGTTFAGGVARSGGAIACEVDAIVTLDGAVFTGNTATLQGGAMWVSGAGVHCSQCQFTANRVSEGTTTTVVSPQLVTAVPGFSSHTLGGGAVYVVHEAAWSRDTRLSDCTFAQNVAPYGGAVRFDGWADDTSCSSPPGACDGNVAYLRFEGSTGLSDNKVAFQGVDVMWSHTAPHNLPVNTAPGVASLPRVLDVAGSAMQALPGLVLDMPLLVTVKDACVHHWLELWLSEMKSSHVCVCLCVCVRV